MKIRNTVTLWLLALVITFVISYYQRKTGPTYPLEGEVMLGQHTIEYNLKRTHGGPGDHRIFIRIPDESIAGTVLWKRYRLDEPTHVIGMKRGSDSGSSDEEYLEAYLPHQPPAGKLEYQVALRLDGETVLLPPDKPAVIRFKGDVPLWALLPHILLMFGALLVGMRAALSAFLDRKPATLSWLTLGLIAVGGLIFGPIVQKYAFGAFWTGWPFGEDLTDNKTAVMALGWLVAVWKLRGGEGKKRGRWWVVAATLLMFAVYLLPHSMRGSELDYSTIPPDSLSNISISRGKAVNRESFAGSENGIGLIDSAAE